MYGFHKELYEITYNTLVLSLAERVRTNFKETTFDNSWGIDHGTWSVLVHMYRKRDIQYFKLVLMHMLQLRVHYQIGQELKPLREEGVLLLVQET